MEKPKRMIDINGDVISEPEHYHESLRWARNMIDAMEEENVDRSDMCVMVERLSEEIKFTLNTMRDRDV